MGRRKTARLERGRSEHAANRPVAAVVRRPTPAIADRLRPWLLGGICSLFVVRPLLPSEAAAEGDGLAVVMLWIALAVFWMLGVVGRPEFRVRFGWTDAAVAALVVWHTIAAVWAARYASPRPAINMLWEWVGMGLSLFLARQFIVGCREARAVAALMVSLAVALAGYGLYQYYYELPATRAAYRADPDGMLKQAGMWLPHGSPERWAFEKRLESVEPIATFALTNSLAGYLAPWLVVGVGIGVATLGQGISRRGLGLLLAVTVVVVVAGECLILTKSRSAYLATATGFLLLAIGAWRQGWIGWKSIAAAGGVTAILVAAALVARGVDAEVLSQATKSLGYRFQYWQGTAGIITEHPLLGCGPGNFQNAYPRHKLPEASEEIAEPHNFALEVWATAGTPALIALLVVLGSFAYSSRTRLACEIASSTPLTLPKPDAVPSAPAAPFPPSIRTDHPLAVLLGGAAGFLLTIPVGMLSGNMLPPEVLLGGLAAASATAALLWPWIGDGQFPSRLPAIGVTVLLINLWAAGGIGFPAVAGSLWLLVALGLEGRWRRLPQRAAWMGLVTALLLAILCYATAYGPVPPSKLAVREAIAHPDRAEAFLRQAAEADPWAAEPWEHLATLAFERWEQDGSSEAIHQFEQALDRAFARAPSSNASWLSTGDRYLQLFEKTRAREFLDKSLVAYRRAVELYPNSARHRAKLAWTLSVCGEVDSARQEGERALELDQTTPHLDKKLPEELRQRLERNICRR